MNALIKTSIIASYFWPGYRKAWDHLDHQSAVVAIVFAWTMVFVGLNLFYWTSWYPGWLVNLATIALVVISIGHGAKRIMFGESVAGSELTLDSLEEAERSFRMAQESYLQGSYFEAEQQLLKNLAINESDIESALLLASVYRRSGKFRESLETLSQLQLKERSARWTTEILVEKEKVLRSKRHSNSGPPPKG
jgi:tetratricopeptide (TPR) repeat protein